MPDTDADLIAQAHKAAPLYGNDWGVLLIKLANALKRHKKALARHSAPLPEAVAGLVARLNYIADGLLMKEDVEPLREAASLIASQAREIERLKKESQTYCTGMVVSTDRAEAAEARVRELEIENNSIALEDVGRDRAIRAATIEECAAFLNDQRFSGHSNLRSLRDAIRALAKEPA
jgi:hypothetical protein